MTWVEHLLELRVLSVLRTKTFLRFVYIKRKRTQFFLAKLTHSGFAHGMGVAFHDKMSLKYVFNEEYHSNWCAR